MHKMYALFFFCLKDIDRINKWIIIFVLTIGQKIRGGGVKLCLTCFNNKQKQKGRKRE